MDRTSSDKARRAAEDALTKLGEELTSGKSESLINYLAVAGRFRRYSWNNVLLIATQRPGATRVAGIHAWNDLGRTVKKGEKGIAILAPIIRKREPSQADSRSKASDSKEPFRLTGFRTAYVFDVAQTDGRPLPEFARTTGDPKDYTDRLKGIAAERGITVEYDPSIAPALGMSSGGRIRLMPDLPKAEEFAVLVHEMAHEILHHSRDGHQLPKVVRETQAEAVAYVVSTEAGLQTNHAAADYIALYNGDKTTLAESLQAIQKTAAQILDDLFPEQARQPVESSMDAPSTEPAQAPVSPRSSGRPNVPETPVSMDR